MIKGVKRRSSVLDTALANR